MSVSDELLQANAEYAKYVQAFPEGKSDGEGLFGIGDNHAEECLFRIAVSQQFHGAFHVGEQHGYLLTLAFKGAF